MAQGPWGTGTWDDARWDSLPLTGNQATGGVGSPSVAVSAALTGVQATGAAGIGLDADFAELTSVIAINLFIIWSIRHTVNEYVIRRGSVP